MYLPKIYAQAAHSYRVRYAIATILRDRVVNEGAFQTCFEMEDGEDVIRTILRRGLKNPKLRAALETSHLVNLTQWLVLNPEYAEAYHATEKRASKTKRAWQATDRISVVRRRGGALEGRSVYALRHLGAQKLNPD